MKYVLLIMVAVAIAMAYNPRCYKESTVKEIGGCGRRGFCGVKMANGDKAVVRYPVVGQTAEYIATCK